MSKKTPVKKSKRRLKRNVRRSLAAVLMITAIAVAAIPVPENFAEDGTARPQADATSSRSEYAYPMQSDPVLDSNGKPVLDKDGNPVYNDHINSFYEQVFDSSTLTTPGNRPKLKTYNIFSTTPNTDNGGTAYRLEWQYEYYTVKVSGEEKGIISGYNDTYPVDLLTVSTEPFGQYDVVDMDKFTKFKTDRANDSFVLNAKPDENDEYDQEFKTYFPALYEQQVQAYTKYETDIAKWRADRKKIEDDAVKNGITLTEQDIINQIGPEPTEPKQITKTASDFSNENDEESWRLYYCNCRQNKLLNLNGYILVRVADSEKTTALGGGTTVFSYVPQRLDMTKKDPVFDDALGFKALTKTSFLGIADNAFKDVMNVKNVELPEALKYIGDSAFEHSYITSIKMVNLTNIGNYAFKNCPNLTKVELENGIEQIGAEAFYGVTGLQEISFPPQLQYIGAGAFADCALLNKVDFSRCTGEILIEDFSFYNDGALGTINFALGTDASGNTLVNITTIGKAAFAVWNNVSGGLTDFVFPNRITEKRSYNASGSPKGKGLGDYILAGRTNLLHVTMPAAYGMSDETEVPEHLFQDCIGLEWVNFPDTGTSCGFAWFEPTLFQSVANPGFYVQGPPYTQPSNRTPARPRESTWVAASAVSNTIPYVYYLNGKRYTEVSDGLYLECIDGDGVLISCMLNPNLKENQIPGAGTVPLVIPSEVAGITVKGIASDCFANDANVEDRRKMSVVVGTLTLKDDSEIATINDSVFANWGNLERVYVGNSVRNIGSGAFQNCISLLDVYFNTPENAVAEFKVGANAFQTNSSQLTFHGPISLSYQPFTWAMDKENTIDDTGRGIRVCYKSLSPTNLTVMRDNGTNQVTLLDYPKYDQIEDLLGESYAIKNGEYGVNEKGLYEGSSGFDKAGYYKKYMESLYEGLYASAQYDGKREQFREAWNATSDKDALYKNFEIYGPWISRKFCEDFNTTRSSADASDSALDWLFEPITVYAASGTPDAYFDTYPYDVYENYTFSGEIFGPYQTYTEEEWTLLNATKNITVPDGVTSIDVNGYMRSGANNGNVSNYLSRDKLGTETYGMYYNSEYGTLDTDRINDVYGGLFSGKYDDKVSGEGEDGTILIKGNDRIESINLNQVTYIPDYAFDSCENLRSVTIGSACTDINKLPFRGCTSLTTLNISEDNPKYLAENRILYSRNDNATYKIEECLETRGRNNDNSLVSSALDTIIPQVTEIAPEAFEACNFISRVNLTDASALTVIPENCFRDCDSLIEVDLPIAVNKVDKGAFVGDYLTRLRIPGREVFISTNAFEHNSDKQQPTYVSTYEDSSAKRYVDTYGDKSQYYLVWEDIGEMWNVNFYDFDGTLLKAMQIEDGMSVKTSEIPEAKREGFTFNKWVGTNNVDVQDPITQDTDFIAQYNSSSQMVDGKWTVDFIDGVTGESFWPPQQVEDGASIESSGASFPQQAPYHDGYKFLKYVYVASTGSAPADFTAATVITNKTSVVALYQAAGAGGTNPGTTSGGTTNISGNGTNIISGNTTSNNSSNNSSNSSTSTTSSTSSKPRHTVTVVNGYGSGSYAEGETVVIVANEPAAGQKFAQWRTSSEGVELVMILASATTFVMPANNVLVTAEYTGSATTTTTTPAPATGMVATNTGNTNRDNNNNNNGNTRVDITKPGISNKNLATANVNGSTDNFIVKISETPEATQAVINALTNKYGNLDNILYYAMDISLYDSTGTTKITDTTGLSVDITIPVPDALLTYGGNNMAGAVVSDQLEDLTERFTTIAGVPCVSFTATHFSPYTIYVNTQNLSEGLLDVTPKTGDPIHPKWFLSIGLASLSIILFLKKDKKRTVKTA